MYKIGLPKLFGCLVFLVSFLYCDSNNFQKELKKISDQIEQLKSLVPEKEIETSVSVKTNYFLIFRSIFNIAYQLNSIDFEAIFFKNLLKIIELIKNFEICIQAFCLILLSISILAIPIETFIFIPSRLFNYFNISFLSNIEKLIIILYMNIFNVKIEISHS